jgi:hypothetical protein
VDNIWQVKSNRNLFIVNEVLYDHLVSNKNISPVIVKTILPMLTIFLYVNYLITTLKTLEGLPLNYITFFNVSGFQPFVSE